MSGVAMRSIGLADVVSRDQFLCWAEAGYMIGDLYRPGALGDFADFTRGVVGLDWDKPGNVEDALLAAGVHCEPLAPVWPLVRNEIVNRRPIVLKSSAVFGHVILGVGVPLDPTIQSIEVMDPEGSGARTLYPWSQYLAWTSTSAGYPVAYSQFRTWSLQAPWHLFVTDPSVWAGLDRVYAQSFVSVPRLPEVAKGGLLSYFASIECSVIGLPSLFPLWSVRLNPGSLAVEKKLVGYRSIFRRTSIFRSLVVDLVDDGAGGFSVLRLMAGYLVDARVARLESLVGSPGGAPSEIYFEDWGDLGLDLEIFRQSPAQGFRIRLFGPRGYYGLKNKGVELDAVTYQTDLLSPTLRWASVNARRYF